MGQAGPKTKDEGKVPNRKAKHLEHSRAYHKAFKDAIKKGWPLLRGPRRPPKWLHISMFQTSWGRSEWYWVASALGGLFWGSNIAEHMLHL